LEVKRRSGFPLGQSLTDRPDPSPANGELFGKPLVYAVMKTTPRSRSADGVSTSDTSSTPWERVAVSEAQREALQSIVTRVRGESAAANAPNTRAPSGVSSNTVALITTTQRETAWSAAQMLATELDRDVHRLDLGTVTSSYIGETEKNLSRAFAQAESAGALLFFEEGDALFGTRPNVKDAHDRYANLDPEDVFRRLAHFHGLAVVATTRTMSSTEPLLRRFHSVVRLP